MIINNHAIVLFSGGQDSTTCLYWSLQRFEKVYAICIDYNQRHRQEIDVARSIAAQAGVAFELLNVNGMGQWASNSLTDSSVQMDSEKPEGTPPNTFVPGRNHLFISLAAIRAQALGVSHLVTGVSQADYSGYPDCRDTFVRSLNVTLNLAMDTQFMIHTPLMFLSKAQTWELAAELGVFDIVKNETLTCYKGVVAEGCGDCPACKLRKKGMIEYLTTIRK